MSENERTIEKDLDYSVEYADGIIAELGNTVSRLIFYQEVLEPSEDGKGLDQTSKVVRLKFEVRIPKNRLSILGRMIELSSEMEAGADTRLRNATYKFDWRRLSPKDQESAKEWWKFKNKLSHRLIDTNDDSPTPDSVDLSQKYRKLKDDFELRKKKAK